MDVREPFIITGDNRLNRENLKGKYIAVLGAARSGLSLSRLLIRSGANVLLSDVKVMDTSSGELRELMAAGVRVEVGGHTDEILNSQLVCISPGIPLTIPVLQNALQKGIPVVGELEVSSWFCDAPMIAITGSSGKTTTTTLTGKILQQKFDAVIVAGNIGDPFAGKILQIPGVEISVLEVSSFQLETILNFHPGMAVITNLTPNHLDRYPDYEAYVNAKLRILQNLTGKDIVLFNADDYLSNRMIERCPARKLPVSASRALRCGAGWKNGSVVVKWEDIRAEIPLDHLYLRGPHNHFNIAVAAALGLIHQVPAEKIRREIEQFRGLPHRLEPLRVLDDVQFVNDSKSTTVASLYYALHSYDQPIVLIAGGRDKGGDFSRLQALLKEKVRAAILIGEASGRIKSAWESVVPVHQAPTFAEAVTLSYLLAKPGDVVLLSPACSSFDMFENYEDRGDQFRRLVQNLKARKHNERKLNI